MLIAVVTAADEAEELVIRQRVWAVIVQDEPQQKMGQLRPESSAAGLDWGLQISRGSSCIKPALSQKHKSNSRWSMSGKEMQIRWAHIYVMNDGIWQSIMIHISKCSTNVFKLTTGIVRRLRVTLTVLSVSINRCHLMTPHAFSLPSRLSQRAQTVCLYIVNLKILTLE